MGKLKNMLTGFATIQDSVSPPRLPPELLSSRVSSEYSEQSFSFKPGSQRVDNLVLCYIFPSLGSDSDLKQQQWLNCEEQFIAKTYFSEGRH